MGNAALRDIAVIEPIEFKDVSDSILAIDAHNWLYRYLTTTVRWTRNEVYTTTNGDEVPNLVGIIQGIPRLLEFNIVPVFVFDGTVAALKAEEIESRREAKQTAEELAKIAREQGDFIEAARYESRTQRLTDIIQRTTRQLLELLDISIVEAPAEGEAQAAHMVSTGSTDYVGTEDYDSLLYGSPRTLRGITSAGSPECMYLDRTLEKHGITRAQLVDVGILCGTDFNEGIRGFGPKTGVTAIQDHGTLEKILEDRGEKIEHFEQLRKMFLNPSVTNDYSIKSTISPDVTAAREFVCETWQVPEDEVARGFERIERALSQTGLDRWT